MHKKALMVLGLAVLLGGCAGLPPGFQGVLETAAPPGALSEGDIADGLREALLTGTSRAVNRLGVTDGFWLNRDLNIPLPENLKRTEKALRALGQGKVVDEFHLSLNRAAEAAVPEALAIFGPAIRAMTLDDARRILDGPPTAATEYFRGKTLPALSARFKPIVMQATSRSGATRRYKELVAKVERYVPNFQTQDLDAYVTERALAGLFRTLGDEERRIRHDPGARTTELMKKVFGATSRSP